MTIYIVPNPQEFADGASRRFSYLLDEFGFATGPAPAEYAQRFAACFWRTPVFVLVEGFSYGFALATSVGLVNPCGHPQDRIHLTFLMRRRRPELLAPRFGEVRGQLEEMNFQAGALRECAEDLLAGDLSQWRALVDAQRQEEDSIKWLSNAAAQRRELERVASRASSAFHAGEYSTTVALLEAHEAVLSKAQSTMLKVARSRSTNAA